MLLAATFVLLNTLNTPILKVDEPTGTFFYSVSIIDDNDAQVEVGMCTWARAKKESILRCTPADYDRHRATYGIFKVFWSMEGKEVKAQVQTSLQDAKIKMEFYVATN